jgi:hypothetical protein
MEYYGRHFDVRRTNDTHGDMRVLQGNFVNLSMPAGSTHFDSLIEFCRSSVKPFPVKFLSEKLKEPQFIRGRVYSGKLGEQIQGILLNYPYLRWWIEQDGLVVGEARSEMGPLSDFDRIAGPIVLEHMKGDKLSASALASIAAKLDAEGFQLKQNLQPAQWKPISDYNQKYSKLAYFCRDLGCPPLSRGQLSGCPPKPYKHCQETPFFVHSASTLASED